ncbi:MAG: putative glycoside hydrolase [Spirochaetes bacterium]|jgi:hypothetical protein|nr:putative glycoside hydrolase [Spirochaetota bacterium]
MKRFSCAILLLLTIISIDSLRSLPTNASEKKSEKSKSSDTFFSRDYKFPDFYRGMYLTVNTAMDMRKLSDMVSRAKQSYINTLVMDAQLGKNRRCMVSEENVSLVLKNGLHPVARIVMFPDGLRSFPIDESYINDRLAIAEEACKNGFKEIQFDYIRFYDSSRLKLTLQQRYDFIEGLLKKMKKSLSKYNVKIAADVFGRIPLNKNDLIGQRMEGLDGIVDVICPMAYPSHYTWSKKLQHDPYYTVYITCKNADERTKYSEIVTYIQAFKMKMGGMPYEQYINDQIRAIHDSGVKGFILWNASQEYAIPLSVTKSFYSKKLSKKEKDRYQSDDES